MVHVEWYSLQTVDGKLVLQLPPQLLELPSKHVELAEYVSIASQVVGLRHWSRGSAL